MSITALPRSTGRHGGLERGVAYLASLRNHLTDADSFRDSLRLLLPPADLPVHPRPVVLVHGWMSRKTAWAQMIEMVHVRGLTDLHAATYNVAVHDVPAAAARVAERVTRVADDHSSPVDIVAHSMGGIAALYALVTTTTLPVASVTTLGSPYRGARLAGYARALPVGPLRAAAQMSPGSTLLTELRDAAAQVTTPWSTLWSTADELVPAPSGELPEHVASRSVRTPDVGHVEMLLSRTVADTVTDAVMNTAAAA